MERKILDKVWLRYFGEPMRATIEEYSEEHKKYFCRNNPGFGGAWYTEEELQEHDQWKKEYDRKQYLDRMNYIRTGGDNGPTGHGDICYSDADLGL